MKEKFRYIPGYENIYQVSNLGNVKSVDRLVNSKSGCKRTVKGKLLNAGLLSHGYLGVSLWKNNKGKMFQIHQLVAMAFLGHKLDGFNLVVDHIDRNKLNNHADNLRIITNRENTTPKKKYTGTYYDHKMSKWGATIRIENKRPHLGFYKTRGRASIAYQFALFQLDKLTLLNS